MLSVLNAAERTASDWRRLFELADRRFVLVGIRRPRGSTMSLIEDEKIVLE